MLASIHHLKLITREYDHILLKQSLWPSTRPFTSHGIPRQFGADPTSLQAFKNLAIDNHFGSSCTVPTILAHGKSGSSTDSSIIDRQGGVTTPSSTPPVLRTLASLWRTFFWLWSADAARVLSDRNRFNMVPEWNSSFYDKQSAESRFPSKSPGRVLSRSRPSFETHNPFFFFTAGGWQPAP
jgi:hypothetical protein